MGDSDKELTTSTAQKTTPPRKQRTITFTQPTLPRIPRPRPSRRFKQVLLVACAVLLAGFAGYVGGQIGSNGGNFNSATLSGQKQIVTSQGELIRQIAKQVGPSVVSINVTSNSGIDFFGYQSTQQAAGTGIIISNDGVIMTNRHVVPEGTTEVRVTLSDGTQYDNVKVLGRTSASDSLDVAFVKIQNLKGKTLTPAVIGDSSQSRVGDSVVAIGNALGQFQNTVTSGILSGFGRNVQAAGEGSSASPEDLGNLIQTDAAINQGNSGGPLVNLNGQVIGMNTAIASNAQNIGFAIPVNDLKGIIEQVLQDGSFKRPYLGVRYIILSKSVANEYALDETNGAYLAPRGITGQPPVVQGSPADKAGLQAGDIITKIDGTAISESKTLTTILSAHKPGDSVRLTVNRDGKTITVVVTLGSVASTS